MEKNGGKDNIFDLFVNAAVLSSAESGVHNLYGDISLAKEPLTAFMGEKRKSSNNVRREDIIKMLIIACKFQK